MLIDVLECGFLECFPHSSITYLYQYFQEGGGFFDGESDNEIILPMNIIEPNKSDTSECKRTYMKVIENEIEVEEPQKQTNVNKQTNERIKKNGKRHGRYYTDGKPQLTKTCGQFNLKPRKRKRTKK